ncbi:MAG: RNA polymerase sporulation sigma factor SigE, partial [Herbinix sp.]|nr:RNA polymerase sporulation sigma factor SigE [Herbinix sp.]
MLLKLSIQNKFQFRMIPDLKTIIFGHKGEIHYIGGAEVLPPPLDSVKEAEVIALLGTERDAEMKSILVEHNLRLVVYIAKKF